MRYLGAVFILLFTLSIANKSKAQEQLGLRLETFAGVNSLPLNPANNLSGSFSWDINLAGLGVFGESNYGFIYQTNVSDILQLLPEVDVSNNYTNENQYPANTLIIDFFDNDRKTYINSSATILGPSFMVKLESGHSFGVFTNLRTAFSAQRIPENLNFNYFDRTPFREEFEVDPAITAGLIWSEIGVNYAKRIETTSGFLDIGVSIKFLNGYEGFFFNSNEAFDLAQFPEDTLSFSNSDFEYGLTIANANTSTDDVSIDRNGSGVGFDLGVVATIDGYEGPYQWKFGAALLDIGKINFTKNAQSHRILTDQPYLIPTKDYTDLTDAVSVTELLSAQSLGDSSLSLQKRNFGIWLPGALSLQADYQVVPNVYVNATLIQRIPYQSNAVKRGNMLAFTPRFEHRWLSAALPISLYNYNRLRIGAAVRLGFISIGTENLTSYIGRSDFTGSDIYFAIRVNPFDLGLNLGSGGGRGGKRVKCYEF